MRRWARRLAIGALALVGVCALVIGGALTLLRTSWGAERVRRVAVARINDSIAGELRLGRFTFAGDRVVLEDVSLRAPDGSPVARAARLEIAFSPKALLRRHVDLRELAVAAPALSVRQDPSGSNLARALAPRRPSPAAPAGNRGASGGGGWTIDLRALQVTEGALDFRSTVPGAERQVAVDGLAAGGDARFAAADGSFDARLAIDARLTDPLTAPLSLRVTGRRPGPQADSEARLDLSLGDDALAATARLSADGRLTVHVGELRVSPRLVRAFAPGVRLLVPVGLTADVTRAGDALTFSATVKAGDGTVRARGALDTARLWARELSVRGETLDLGRVVEGLPRSAFSFDLEGHGGGRDPGALTGALSFVAPAGRFARATFGAATIELGAEHGHYQLSRLNVAVPGLTVTGAGTAAVDHLALRVAVQATDLEKTARALWPALPPGAPPPTLAGSGRVGVTIGGTVAAPSLDVDADIARLVVNGDRVSGLKIAAHIPDARGPTRTSGDVTIKGARLGGHDLGDIAVRVRSTRAHFDASVRSGAPYPLSLVTAGDWEPSRQAFTLSRLDLAYPGSAWTLIAPTRLAFGDDHLLLGGLDLRGGGAQRIRADLEKRGPRVRGRVELDAIDLGALPKLALPPTLILAGHLDVRARVTGTIGQPTLAATVKLAGGRIGPHRNLSLDLDGDYSRGRARGHFDATGLGTSARARFDVPTVWPPRDRAAPLSLDLDLAETGLPELLNAAGLSAAQAHGVKGRVGLSLRLHGTEAAPTLALDARLGSLVVDGQAVGNVTLHLAGAGASPVEASVAIEPSGAAPASRPALGRGALKVRTTFSLAELARRPPGPDELLRAHLALDGELKQIPLGELARLAGVKLPLAGTASVRLAAAGTAAAPTGALNIQLADVTGPGIPPTDARLDANFGERDVRLAARITRRQHELAWLSGTLGLPARKLSNIATLAAAPVDLRVGVGPIDLHRRGVPGTSDPDDARTLGARVSALLSLEGSLRAPRARLTTQVWNARLDKIPLGDARGLFTYADRRAALDLRVASASGGELRLAAESPIELGYPRVVEELKGMQVKKIPLHVDLDARRFDLVWLSGIDDLVRAVGGELTAQVSARGTVGAPTVKGTIAWDDGVLTLTDLGAYRKIHLRAHGDETAAWLDELTASSGEGSARLTASAARGPSQAYDLKANTKLERFPIYGQGQAIAEVSLSASFGGTATAALTQIRAKISAANVELTNAKQKDLQPLDRPADIVLMDHARPLDRAEARKLTALAAALDRSMGPPASGAQAGTAAKRAAVPKGGAPAPERRRLAFRLNVDAPRNLWIKNKDASLELGLGSAFRVEVGERVYVFGEIDARRGRVDVLGRRFDVQSDSTVRFIGAPDAPVLDVKAKYVNDAENITVVLTATGALDHLAVAVSSPDHPELTQGQLYTLIITGHLQLGGDTTGSTSASTEAASLVGGLVAAKLQKALAKNLPLDVFTIQSGDGEGLSGSRLEAGTYLTSKLYAGYVGRVGANPALLQNRNALHLEYQLSQRWSFDAEYGDVGTGTADILRTKRY